MHRLSSVLEIQNARKTCGRTNIVWLASDICKGAHRCFKSVRGWVGWCVYKSRNCASVVQYYTVHELIPIGLDSVQHLCRIGRWYRLRHAQLVDTYNEGSGKMIWWIYKLNYLNKNYRWVSTLQLIKINVQPVLHPVVLHSVASELAARLPDRASALRVPFRRHLLHRRLKADRYRSSIRAALMILLSPSLSYITKLL